MKADVGDYIIYKTINSPDNESDLFGVVMEVAETGVGVFHGGTLDRALWGEIKDVVKGSEASRQLIQEYCENLENN